MFKDTVICPSYVFAVADCCVVAFFFNNRHQAGLAASN